MITLLTTDYDKSLRIFLCHLMLWIDDFTTQKFTECSLSMAGEDVVDFRYRALGLFNLIIVDFRDPKGVDRLQDFPLIIY